MEKAKNETELGVDFRDGITDEDVEKERDIYTKDQKRIDKKYNNKKHPGFKLVAEYLNTKFIHGEHELDKNQICEDLEIDMGTLNLYLGELGRYEKFPLRWIGIYGKKDFIQESTANFKNSIKWIKANWKSTVSRTARVFQTKQKVQLKEEEEALKEFMKKRQEQKKALEKPKTK